MKLLLLTVFLIATSSVFAQTILDSAMEIDKEQSAITFLSSIEVKHRVRFSFKQEWLQFSTVLPQQNGETLKSILDRISNQAGVSYRVLFDYHIIFTKDLTSEIARDNLLYKAAAAKKTIQHITLGQRERDYRPDKRVVITGMIKSEVDNQPLAGVFVEVEIIHLRAISDTNGTFKIELPAGEYVVVFHHQNFADKVVDLKAYASGNADIILEEAPTILQEVEVSDHAIVTGRQGQSSLLIKNLKRGPTFLGEADVIKNLQVQPGVTSVGEISSGFNVRGGGTDQNLVLYDGVPIFNTSHALGFFSGFNAEAIGNVTFYRGGIPAEFGGRASSVLNITSREGDYKKWSAAGGIGIISSNLTVGGPIKRDTSSITASIRSSYSNWLLRKIRSTFAEISDGSLSFYDASIKYSHRFSQKTKLQISGYTSHDSFSFATDTIYQWRNFSGSARIDHVHSEKLFSTITLGIGTYGYQLSDADPESAFKLNYGINYPSVNLDMNYNGFHSISFGLHNTFNSFHPGELKPTSPESSRSAIKIANENSLETAFYVSDAFQWRENIFVELGLRYSIYNRLGAGTVFHYLPGMSIDPRNTTDSTHYTPGKIMKTYHGPEPRISFRYLLNANASVKFGFNRIYQYLHLITNTAAITPVDIWQSSNSYFKPQIADQISLGYYRTLRENMFEAFVEAYYKNIQNILEFRDGSSLILNKKIETALLPGKSISYGAEFSVSKIKGRLQGIANYTISRSLRKVDGAFPQEKINDGKYYASNNDQPHVANINWRYALSRRHFFSWNFTYHTGRPMSTPRDGYIIDRNVISDFSERNKYRIPDYHRLDIAFIIEGTHKRKKLADGTWTISFYNVYARQNAYSVFYEEDKESGRLVPYKLSVIGTVIPSLSYSFKL